MSGSASRRRRGWRFIVMLVTVVGIMATANPGWSCIGVTCDLGDIRDDVVDDLTPGPIKVKIPAGIPVVTVGTTKVTAITPDALGAPGRPVIKTDATLVKGVQPAFDVKRNAQQGQVGTQGIPAECSPGRWYYDISGGWQNQFVQSNNPTWVMENDTDTTQRFSVSSSKSGSVGVSVTAGVEAEAGVIVASVKTKFEIQASVSVGWSQTVTVDVTVPPHTTYAAAYGAHRAVSNGRYYYVDRYCERTVDKGVIQSSTPYGLGFRVWKI